MKLPLTLSKFYIFLSNLCGHVGNVRRTSSWVHGGNQLRSHGFPRIRTAFVRLDRGNRLQGSLAAFFLPVAFYAKRSLHLNVANAKNRCILMESGLLAPSHPLSLEIPVKHTEIILPSVRVRTWRSRLHSDCPFLHRLFMSYAYIRRDIRVISEEAAR